MPNRPALALLPCPFCGSDAKLVPAIRGHRAFVECSRVDCETTNPDFVDIFDTDSAVESAACWNRRAEATAARLEALERDAERYRWLRDRASGADARRIVNDSPEGIDAAIDIQLDAERSRT